MLRITARYADEWNTWGHLETAGRRRQAFVEACEAVGRDPMSMRSSVQALLFVDPSPETVERTRSGPYADRCLFGSIDELVDVIGRYEEMGFEEFIVPDFNLGRTPEARREALARIDAELVPRC
jgi:alkanesulfonate monooxygenase SsuD/methylene tetrahydromethanopterin reductase-like flavin-dependent oxidoreductase (luciferase family)